MSDRKSILQRLLQAVYAAQAALQKACKDKLNGDEYAYYRMVEAGTDDPELKALNDEYTKALHEFYLARDGDKGVLGH